MFALILSSLCETLNRRTFEFEHRDCDSVDATVSRFAPYAGLVPSMPPRVGTHVNALKRKAAEDAKSQGREKRTRSSGVPPSHFIPLDGAPQPSKSINSSSPSAPHLVHLDKKKPRRPLQTAQPRLGTAPHDSGPDSRHSSAETNSEDEMSLKSAHNHSAHITSPQKDGKLVAEVEISPRKVNPSMCHHTRTVPRNRFVHPDRFY